MIIHEGSGEGLTLIGQTDHSRFVGQLAAHWGNDDFAPLQPFESVVRAATYHDFGYLLWEPDPDLDPATGEPYQFRTQPFSQRQLDAYQWCIDWLRSVDPYSGLLVSMHRTGLWKGRYGKIERQVNVARGVRPEVEEMIERNETWQAEERACHDEDEVWTNYQLLQVWDLLGLYFCCREPCEDSIAEAPISYGGKPGVRLDMHPVGGNRVAFDPYPFDQRPLRVQIGARQLPVCRFADRDSFRRAYYQGRSLLLEYELV